MKINLEKINWDFSSLENRIKSRSWSRWRRRRQWRRRRRRRQWPGDRWTKVLAFFLFRRRFFVEKRSWRFLRSRQKSWLRYYNSHLLRFIWRCSVVWSFFSFFFWTFGDIFSQNSILDFLVVFWRWLNAVRLLRQWAYLVVYDVWPIKAGKKLSPTIQASDWPSTNYTSRHHLPPYQCDIVEVGMPRSLDSKRRELSSWQLKF